MYSLFSASNWNPANQLEVAGGESGCSRLPAPQYQVLYNTVQYLAGGEGKRTSLFQQYFHPFWMSLLRRRLSSVTRAKYYFNIHIMSPASCPWSYCLETFTLQRGGNTVYRVHRDDSMAHWTPVTKDISGITSRFPHRKRSYSSPPPPPLGSM